MYLENRLSEPEGIDNTAFTDMIKEQFVKEERLNDYYNFLERTFEPKRDRKNCEDFHKVLVCLGFCGFATTNYDVVLEEAVRTAYINENGPFQCESIDLCDERPYRVLDFLRELPIASESRCVLHLHGYYKNPKQIIMTESDYLVKYGEKALDEYGKPKPIRGILDTLHRKVIWSLLSIYPLLFVGFSMKDEFFMQMLRVVQTDFMSGSDPLHFAILPCKIPSEKEEVSQEKEKISKTLKRSGVLPIFYYIPHNSGSHDSENHNGLIDLVYELARSVGTPVGPTNFISLTKKMLER